MLQPRKFKYKTRQKKRRSYFATNTDLVYGDRGVLLERPYRISAKKIFRLKLFLKRSSKKAARTGRLFWVSAFPHLPLSRKPKGMRMGKGSGKLSTWYTQVRGGVTLIEFKNLRYGRSSYFAKQVAHKLPVPVTITERMSRSIVIPGARKTNPLLTSFY